MVGILFILWVVKLSHRKTSLNVQWRVLIFQLHPEDGKVSLLDWCIEGCTKTETQDQSGIHWINNPIIAQPDKKTKQNTSEQEPTPKLSFIQSLPRSSEGFPSYRYRFTDLLLCIIILQLKPYLRKGKKGERKMKRLSTQIPTECQIKFMALRTVCYKKPQNNPKFKNIFTYLTKNFPVPLLPTQTYKSN